MKSKLLIAVAIIIVVSIVGGVIYTRFKNADTPLTNAINSVTTRWSDYKVISGDRLSSLASKILQDKCGVDVPTNGQVGSLTNAIAKKNGMENANKLSTGKVILLPNTCPKGMY